MSNEAPTDALRLVPVEPTREQWLWVARIVRELGPSMSPGAMAMTMERLAEKAAPASPLPGGVWQDISTAPKGEGVKVMAFDGIKVGEAVLYGEWEESNDFEDAVLRWRWANDSCSCCWGKAEPQPTHWMPLPSAPTGKPK